MITNTGKFLGKTVFVTGGSRGIGKAIALKVARDGANVVVAAKTTEKHAKLEGTIYTAAKEIEKAGGKCYPVKCDLRSEEDVARAIEKCIKQFGSLDVLVNNASAISLTGTEDTSMKRYDLMHTINTRGTFMASKYAIPHLKKSKNPHILNLSPPLLMEPKWFGVHVAYTMAKYGMSMCVLGMAEEFKEQGIAVNALWPRTAIWTAAMNMLSGENEETSNMCRKPDIMADAAYAILSKKSQSCTGNFFVDEEFLRGEGITNFDYYAMKKGSPLLADFFIPDHLAEGLGGNPSRKESNAASQPSAVQDPSLGEGQLSQFFNKARDIITDDIKNDINALVVFSIGDKHYLVDAHASKPLKIELLSEAPAVSDVTMITDEETFVEMSEGKMKPTNAFMQGKLKIKGNIGVAMKVEKMFKAMRSNL